MTTYNLYKLLKEELGNGSSDLVTNPYLNKVGSSREEYLESVRKGELNELPMDN